MSNPTPDDLQNIIEKIRAMAQPQQEKWLRETRIHNPELYATVSRAFTELPTAELVASLKDAPMPEIPEEETPDLTGQEFGSWKLVRPIGSGGMGSVWLAERADESFSMQAAVKLLKINATSQRMIDHFKAERQILADLRHPNIAVLHDGGKTADGHPYFVMEYISGDTIDHWCKEHKPTTQKLLQLFHQLCLAVDYAHRKGILHRDIKPSNIMIDVEGLLKLMDFGIAASSDSSTRTEPGRLQPMTPDYASPERLKGAVPTEAADIYALGLVLLELITGTRPWREHPDLEPYLDNLASSSDSLTRALLDLLQQMLRVVPEERISKVAIVLKQVESLLEATQEKHNDPVYLHLQLKLSLQQFQEDSAQLLQEPLLTQVTALLDRDDIHLSEKERHFINKSQKHQKREQGKQTQLLMIAVVLGLALIASIIYAINMNVDTDQNQQKTAAKEWKGNPEEWEAKKRAKEAAERERLEALYKAKYNTALTYDAQAAQALDQGKPQQAWLSTLSALSLETESDRSLHKTIGRFADPRMALTEDLLWTSSSTPELRHVFTSGDQKTMVAIDKQDVIRILDLITGKQLRALSQEVASPLRDVAISPNGTFIAAVYENFQTYLWTLKSPINQARLLPITGPIQSLAFDKDNRLLALADQTGGITFFTLGTGHSEKPLLFQKQLAYAIHDIAFRMNEKTLVIACENGVHALKLDKDDQPGPFQIIQAPSLVPATSIAVHPAGHIASGWQDGSVRFHQDRKSWDVTKLQGRVKHLAFSPKTNELISNDGKQITATTLPSPQFENPNLETRDIPRLKGILNFAVGQSGHLFAVHQRGRLSTTDLSSDRPVARVIGHQDVIKDLAFTPDGNKLASAAHDGRVFTWDFRAKAEPKQPFMSPYGFNAVAFSSDGKHLAAGDTAGTIYLSSNGSLSRLLQNRDEINDLVFCANDKKLLVASRDSNLYLWSLEKEEIVGALRGHDDAVNAVALSPDGKTIASTSNDGSIRLWELNSL